MIACLSSTSKVPVLLQKPLVLLGMSVLFVRCSTSVAVTQPHVTIPVSAPLTTDALGKTAKVANDSVFRVVCITSNLGGSGFLHRGAVITAAHVLADCRAEDLVLIASSGAKLGVERIEVDMEHDLGAAFPKQKPVGRALVISRYKDVPIGSSVIAWGYPAGYTGLLPILVGGYISGHQTITLVKGKPVEQWVVNAAFNGGNSGGPILDTEDGSVIGVVSSKLAPLPPAIESALTALRTNPSGFSYKGTDAQGKEIQLSEAQVVAAVLDYLRSQTQLVIGYGVSLRDLKDFIQKRVPAN
jgi:S1-C subfamily serine protease